MDRIGKQPVKFVDKNGYKHILWTVVVMVRTLKKDASPKRLNHLETTKYAARDDAAYTMSACRLAHLISAHFIVVRPLGQKVRRELLPKAILQLLATTLSRG